ETSRTPHALGRLGTNGAALMASLDEFLLTGRLGPLEAGMSLDEVRALLGEPGDVSVQKLPKLWRYGALELAFYKEPENTGLSLESISLSFHDPEEVLPNGISLAGWIPSAETTIQEFQEHLAAVGIRDYGGATQGPDKHLAFPSGARVDFDDDLLI